MFKPGDVIYNRVEIGDWCRETTYIILKPQKEEGYYLALLKKDVITEKGETTYHNSGHICIWYLSDVHYKVVHVIKEYAESEELVDDFISEFEKLETRVERPTIEEAEYYKCPSCDWFVKKEHWESSCCKECQAVMELKFTEVTTHFKKVPNTGVLWVISDREVKWREQ